MVFCWLFKRAIASNTSRRVSNPQPCITWALPVCPFPSFDLSKHPPLIFRVIKHSTLPRSSHVPHTAHLFTITYLLSSCTIYIPPAPPFFLPFPHLILCPLPQRLLHVFPAGSQQPYARPPTYPSGSHLIPSP